MLKTERLEFVKFDKKYANELYDLWSDPEVVKYTYMPLMHTVEECEAKIDMFLERTDDEFTNNFIVLYEGKAIGIIGAPIVSKEEHCFGFFYQLKREYWGKGFMSEITFAFKQYLKEHYPDVMIKADAVAINTASIKILSKLGFVQTHIEENGFVRDDKEFNIIHFSYPK